MNNAGNFYVQAYYGGGLASFEVIPMEGAFGIAHHGELIAEVEINETWEQTMGDPLEKKVLQSITRQIDKHQNGD